MSFIKKKLAEWARGVSGHPLSGGEVSFGDRSPESNHKDLDGMRQEYEVLLQRAYDDARLPYRESPTEIPEEAFQKSSGNSSWRYFVEINSACDLHCSMCMQGDLRGYEHKNGIMNQDLFERVVDKIKMENDTADICLYGNSEPFLHPRLPECVSYIRKSGLTCLVSTNFNRARKLQEVLEAEPSYLIISVSGFSQEIYGRAHRGGDIEKVKENLRRLSKLRTEMGSHVPVLVHYHLYRDNWGEEFDNMKAFAGKLGFPITPTWARSISMEKTIQYLRYREKKTTGRVPPLKVTSAAYGGQCDWASVFPEVTEEFLIDMERLGITPDEATEFYKQYPTPHVCPIGDLFTYIRYDGSVCLCSCFADRRLSVATDFLNVSQEEIRRRRRWQSICHECLRYKMHMYFHVLNIPMWDEIMAQRFPEIPPDRRKF